MDQLPMLLILSPLIGFLVTLAATKAERDLVRHLAISNVICSIILFAAVFWQVKIDQVDESFDRQRWKEEALAAGEIKNIDELVNHRLDRRRVERMGYRWFVMDGFGLWPAGLLIMLIGCVFWQVEITAADQNGFFPLALLFEAASLAGLMAYDVRVFLLAMVASVLVMGLMLGLWGGPDRRALSVQFLTAQFCGGALVMLGFVMLVVAVPWMKIEDSPVVPTVTWNIVRMTYEIQKWSSGNPLAFQYQNEVFPWILLVLSGGFGIQAGLFPFHHWLISVLCRAPGSIVILLMTGVLSIAGAGWLRFVMPLAPELMAAFDWLILVPALGSALWGAIRALSPSPPRQRLACLILSFGGLSLLGAFSFSRTALSGMWLMQLQLIVAAAAGLMALAPRHLLLKSSWNASDSAPFDGLGQFDLTNTSRSSDISMILKPGAPPGMYLMLFVICLSVVGFFGSGYVIFCELFRESWELVLCMLFVAGSILFTINSLTKGYALRSTDGESGTAANSRVQGPVILVILIAMVTNLFPQQILMMVEPDLARVFQKYEQPSKSDDPPGQQGDRQ